MLSRLLSHTVPPSSYSIDLIYKIAIKVYHGKQGAAAFLLSAGLRADAGARANPARRRRRPACGEPGEREEIKARETPKEYVVCVLDEDKNPTDCVPYGDFVSEHRPPDPSEL